MVEKLRALEYHSRIQQNKEIQEIEKHSLCDCVHGVSQKSLPAKVM